MGKELKMRFRYIFAVLIILAFSASLFAQDTGSEGSKLVEQLKFPELTWQIPELGKEVTVDTLDNGIVLFMMEDHRLPVFNIRGIVRTGSIYDPDGLDGLASITGTVMRSGGTVDMTPDSLNAILEYLAASIETYIGTEQGGVSMNCLAKDMDQCLGLMADVLMHPEFRQDQIDLQKDKIKESIRRRNDNPNSIANREFNHLLYDDSPYGRIQEWEPITKITRQDMIDFYNKYFVPNNLWLGVTGDFNKDDIEQKISAAFAGWQSAKIDFPPTPEVKKKNNPGVFIVDKDLTQSSILFGQLGIKQDNPDRYAIAIMNYILGGGSFTSRMTSVVRSDMGLAYSVGSRFETDTRYVGDFEAYCQTKTSTTYKAMYNMLDQIKIMRKEKVSDYELKAAKDSYINRFVFQFTNPAQIVSRLMGLEYDGMPRDFYQNYISNIKAVTVDDVLAVAKKYLKPQDMTFLVVGNSSEFADQLKEFGEISYIKLENPLADVNQ